MRVLRSWIAGGCTRFGTGRAMLFGIWALLALSGSAAAGASLTASLDRTTMVVGETATLVLKFDGGKPDAAPVLPTIPGLQITGQGTSQQYSLANGRFAASVSYNYAVVPTQPGEYTIPAITATVDGQTLSTQPLKLQVGKPGAAAGEGAGDPLAMLKLQPSKTRVYAGEVFVVDLLALFKEGVANADDLLRSFDNFNGNPLKTEGVNILKTAHGPNRRGQVGNSVYRVATISVAVTAFQPGKLTLQSIDANLSLHLPTGQRRRDPFWDPFGLGQQLQARQIVLSADPVEVEVLPLPEGAPPEFNGAVGRFTISATASPTNVAVGDPITLRLQISGQGSLESLQLPNLHRLSGFKLYPPTTKLDPVGPLGLEGTKMFEQVISPEKPDIQVLPGVTFAFFDPESKSYQRVTSETLPITVRPAGPAPMPQVSSYAPGQTEESQPEKDIVHIKPRAGPLLSTTQPLIYRPWFAGLQLVPVLCFLGAVAWRKRLEHLARNPRLIRRQKTDKLIRAQLTQLRSRSNAGESAEVFAGVFRVLQERLGERLDLPASAITEAVIEEHLKPRGVPASTVIKLEELFQACNAARYAPVAEPAELSALLNKLETTLAELEAALK